MAFVACCWDDSPEAWPLFELREVAEEVKLDKFTQPRWDGSPLGGKTIVIHAEQGIGDEVLFASCFADVIAQAEKTILVCEPRLAKLFAAVSTGHGSRLDAAKRLVADAADRIDRLSNSRRQSAALSAKHARKFSAARKFSYSRRGNGSSVARSIREIGTGLENRPLLAAGGKANEGRKRTIPLLEWEEILETAGVHFVNLQYSDASDDLAAVERELGAQSTIGSQAIRSWIWTATPRKLPRSTW